MPIATACMTASKETEVCRSRGWASARSPSETPTASTMTKRVLASASGMTLLRSSLPMTRNPRPFLRDPRKRPG